MSPYLVAAAIWRCWRLSQVFPPPLAAFSNSRLRQCRPSSCTKTDNRKCCIVSAAKQHYESKQMEVATGKQVPENWEPLAVTTHPAFWASFMDSCSVGVEGARKVRLTQNLPLYNYRRNVLPVSHHVIHAYVDTSRGGAAARLRIKRRAESRPKQVAAQ